MEFFDKFKRKKNQSHQRKAESIEEKRNKQQYDYKIGMRVENDILKRVYEHALQNGTFIVPDHIKSIDMFAFSSLKDLKTVVLHKDIKRIAQNAFLNCSNLVEVKGLEDADKLKVITGFSGCESLKTITLPESVECIEYEAFLDCKRLTDINIPYGCWGISRRSFAGCESLQTLQLPATLEVINEEAFAGCENASIIFLEDDKKLLADFIEEQKKANQDSYGEDSDESQIDSEQEFDEDSAEAEEPKPTLEEKIQLYEDLNIRYRIIEIAGEKFFWPSKPLEVLAYAFSGVKEVISSSESKIRSVVESGYMGKVSLAYPENNQLVTVDLGSIEQAKQDIKQQAREEYYSKFLIPKGGTTNWLINCEKNHYNVQGYAGKIIWEMPIFEDAKIEVADFTQPKSSTSKYTKDEEEFFTSFTFHKKEIVVGHKDGPSEYNRQYSIYYPFGARFDTQMLMQAGIALSALIDTARDLAYIPENQEQLNLITQKQKQIIDLFINGTKDPNAILDIMSDERLHLSPISKTTKVAQYQKDYLPYFTEPLFDEFEELEEYRKEQASKNENKPKEKD